MKNAKNSPVEGFIEHLWRWSPLVVLLVAVGLFCGSCGAIHTIPIETTTEVHYIDSVRYEIRDSIRIIERSRWKDYGGLLDTVRIRGNHSEATAYMDTTRNIINAELEESPREEKTRIIYRDRWKTRDSLVFQDRPVPYEITKEVEVVPKFWRVLGIIGIISILLAVLWSIMKLKTSGLLSKIISIFK